MSGANVDDLTGRQPRTADEAASKLAEYLEHNPDHPLASSIRDILGDAELRKQGFEMFSVVAKLITEPFISKVHGLEFRNPDMDRPVSGYVALGQEGGVNVPADRIKSFSVDDRISHLGAELFATTTGDKPLVRKIFLSRANQYEPQGNALVVTTIDPDAVKTVLMKRPELVAQVTVEAKKSDLG